MNQRPMFDEKQKIKRQASHEAVLSVEDTGAIMGFVSAPYYFKKAKALKAFSNIPFI